jgi:hypothetical protein
MLLLGGYSFLILPAIILIMVAFMDRSQNPQPSRRKLLMLLSLTTLVLALLGLLIWFNPYGREISSSPPAYGVLIVLVALLAYLFSCWREVVQLWSGDKPLVGLYLAIFLILFSLLWLAEHLSIYLMAGLTLAAVLAWYLARTGFAFLGILSVLTLGTLVINTGGAFFIPAGKPSLWVNILTAIALLLSVLLPAGVMYAILRDPTPVRKSWLLYGLVLIFILSSGAAYQLAWDGIWSSAHDRAFEDHLPFVHFMVSLIAGVLLVLTLRGWRRVAGPFYVVLVTTVTVLALVWGWNQSAFEMTQRRAATVEQAILNYYDENETYPVSLAELSPRYLPFLLPPVVVRTGGWCYQSGEGFYRLGYVSGDFTYFEREFKVVTYASAGDLSNKAWVCDELRARLQANELTY